MISGRLSYLIYVFLVLLLFDLALILNYRQRNNRMKFDKAKYCKCENLTSNSRTINANEISEKFEWVASIFGKGILAGRAGIFYQHFCSGVVINPLFVLTSASCFVRAEETSVALRVGAGLNHDLFKILNSKNNIRIISSSYQHPLYRKLFMGIVMYDIMILELDEPFDISDNAIKVQPACLFDKNDTDFKTLQTIVAGYGDENTTLSIEKGLLVNQRRVQRSDIVNKETKLSYANVRYVDQMNLTKKLTDYLRPDTLPYNFLFTNAINASKTCAGDEGAPLMMNENKKTYVIGILNSNLDVNSVNLTKQFKCSSVAVYNPIYEILEWIMGQFTGNNLCTNKTYAKIDTFGEVFGKIIYIVTAVTGLVLFAILYVIYKEFNFTNQTTS